MESTVLRSHTRRLTFPVLALAVFPLPLAPRATPSHALHVATHAAVADSMFVSTAWVGDRLGSSDLVLLHIGQKAEYDAAHLPGSRWLDYDIVSTPRGSGLTLQLPPAAQLAASLEALGISN